MPPITEDRAGRLATAASVALVLTLLAAGCSTSGGDDEPRAPGTTPGASRGESPVQACTRQVSYWVGETLRLAPDQGFDYQHMGLSGRTYEVVQTVTEQARAAGRSDPGWVAERARAGCEEAIGTSPDATSTSGGWP